MERLHLLNAHQLEKKCQMAKGRIADVRRGKAKLSSEELERIRAALAVFK